MPSETEMLEHVLVRAKDRKSSKKCRTGKCNVPKHSDGHKHSNVPKPCEVDCCLTDCNPDCCTPAFQRLDKLRQVWQLTQYGLTVPVTRDTEVLGSTTTTFWNSSVYNRAGQIITDVSPLNGNVQYGTLELSAYAFVNEVRYLNYEECGKFDQVAGWSIDLQLGDLYFYQNLPDLGLLTSDSRTHLLNKSAATITPNERRKLAKMEPFWKLSLKAVDRVRENPKTEGNVCEIKDKCGNRFLVAINRADGQSATNSVCEYNSQYSIVAVKLC